MAYFSVQLEKCCEVLNGTMVAAERKRGSHDSNQTSFFSAPLPARFGLLTELLEQD